MTAILAITGVALFLLIYIRDKYLKKNPVFFSSFAPIQRRIVRVPQRYRDILQQYFRYYQLLNPDDKIRFEKRVTIFVSNKQFVPRNIDEVTIEAKVLIAACAVQLTFGLREIYLEHFSKILVYPNDYYSSITKRYHRGEVNPRFGIIVLSWQSFVDGYIDRTDSFNVGLHEMAHALRLENIIRNEEYQFFNFDLIELFDTYATRVCQQMENEEIPFFRPYACTNHHEFFSVAIENFFERPQQFNDALPELYDILRTLLNQDPR